MEVSESDLCPSKPFASQKRGLVALERRQKKSAARTARTKSFLLDDTQKMYPASGGSMVTALRQDPYHPLSTAISPALSKCLLLPNPGASVDPTATEKLVLRLFESSCRSFRHDAAISGKLHDKVLLLRKASKGRSVSAAVAVREAKARCRKRSGQIESTSALKRAHGGRGLIDTLRLELARSGASYEDIFNHLNPPWEEYLVRLCGGCSKKEVERRLGACEWAGAEAHCVASGDDKLAGVEGVVLWVSREYVHLMSRQDALASVRRKISSVEFVLPKVVAEAIGSRVELMQGHKCP